MPRTDRVRNDEVRRRVGIERELARIVVQGVLTWFGHIIIISSSSIKRGRQCKAERERYTPYQSEGPSPTLPTYRQEKRNGKIVEDYSRDRAA